MRFFLTLALGLIGGIVGAALLLHVASQDPQRLISDFYSTENAVHVSPHSIRKSIMKHEGNFILVDLRSAQEYEKEHIVGAVNIPAYKDPDTSAYDDVDRIVAGFQALDQSKNIVVYCYSISCMTGRKIGKMLSEHNIFVKHLGIGWNEWRYFWDLWNHEHEWKITDVKEYITSGKEPGTFRGAKKSGGCPVDSDFGC